ncbi:hypothetical protein DICPUDRAFT_55843 [Dictyostelium purpureum]|uniref:PX domain-containing protein n=1 Tax=Dictyostelium purpureum TaxID=5786 RepID=F0ZNR1_DICPU|nr:uncharacterized protein DICPUDRAFT_55843 [Dictyostelium purpureum]EGC34419.1 hypothetical protein DICPUDRAFT_55843 [Dictyostelium purpureum]|eukprot:XP_003289048.1 hypothetical protein DICPUDRAFT_55843 [Dictyostelium purpureum]
MSGYDSNLLFGTQVTYEDNQGAFEAFSNEQPVDNSSNPFLEPQQSDQQDSASYPTLQKQYSREVAPNTNSLSQPQSYNSNSTVTQSNGVVIQQKQRTSQNYQSQSTSQGKFQPSFKAPTLKFVSAYRTSMDITVCPPDMIGEGMGAYAIYKIITKQSLNDNPDYKKETSVSRRYSDFLWLRNVLKETRKGCLIPQLPEKAVLNNRNKDFLEQRRRDLEKFLNRVVESGSLSQANEITVFLEGSDEQLAAAKQNRPAAQSLEESTASPPPAAQPEGKMGKFTSFFGNSINQISNLAQGVHSVKEVDGWFGEKKSYILDLDVALRRFEENVSNVIRRRRELAMALGELKSAGLSFSSCEVTQHQEIANSYQRLGDVEDNIRQGMEDLSNNEQGYFEEGIRDYLKAIASVKELLNDRLDALMNMQNHERAVASKKEKFEKLKVSNSGKAASMQKEVDDAVRKLTESSAEYEKISATARLELTKFDEKRTYEMKRILNYVIRLNLDHFLKSSDSWRELLTEQHQNGDPNFDNKTKASWGSSTI